MSETRLNFDLLFEKPDTNQSLSSNEFADIATSSLVPADFLYTFLVRYLRLGADFHNMHDEFTSSNGDSIDFSSTHHEFAIVETLFILAAAVGNTVVTYKSMKKGKQRVSYQTLYQSYLQGLTPSTQPDQSLESKASSEVKGSPDAKSLPSGNSLQLKAEELNQALQMALSRNKSLSDKYKKIQVAFIEKDGKPAGLKVNVEKKPKKTAPWYAFWDDNWTAPWVAKKAVVAYDTTTNMLGMASYAYWILFIGAAVFTATFGVGVVGLPDLIGFGIPFLLGSAYVGIKLKNKIANKNTHKEEQNDFNALTEEAMLDIEEAKATKGLDPLSKADVKPSLKATTGVAGARIVNAAVFGGVGAYVTWQYNMWYVTDVLSKIFQVAVESAAEAIGIGIVVAAGLALVRAGYNAYQDYKKDKNKIERKSIWDYFKPDTHASLLEQQLQRVNQLENEIAGIKVKADVKTPQLDALIQQQKDGEASSKTKPWMQRMRNLLHVANFGMTGVYVARTVLVRGVTAFLLPGLAAAVCLSTPWTIGILVLAGVIWGAYKYYNYRKEKNLQKIQLANKHIELLERKRNILKRHELSENKLAAPSPSLDSDAARVAASVSPAPEIVATVAPLTIAPEASAPAIELTPVPVVPEQPVPTAAAVLEKVSIPAFTVKTSEANSNVAHLKQHGLFAEKTREAHKPKRSMGTRMFSTHHARKSYAHDVIHRPKMGLAR